MQFRRSRVFGLCCAAAVATLGSLAAAGAEARVARIFQDNMVLQRNAQVPVWGWGSPGDDVHVSFAGQQVRGKADAAGYWKVLLEPMPASRQARGLTVRIGEAEIERKDVLVGEVWIAAGQSNMNHSGPDRDTGFYPPRVSPGARGERAQIRITRFGFGASLEPQPDIAPTPKDAPWQVLAEAPPPASVNLPICFARIVRDGVNVPVGIVHVAVSGTNQGAWMARETLEGFPGGKGKPNYYEELFAYRQQSLAKKGKTLKSWEDFDQAAKQWWQTQEGKWPGDMAICNFPTALYNTRIHPLAPFAVQGVIWHQGEGGPGGPYGERLVAMATQWRKLFGQHFAFVWGTLTRNTASSPDLTPKPAWFYRSSTNAGIRRALKLFGEDENVALVELYDVGDQDTHFLQKAEAGRRMGLAALTVAYGQRHIYRGPLATGVTIEGNKARVTFDSAGKGIVYKPSIDGISGVYVKDAKGPHRWGNATVVDQATIEISHPEIEAIAAVGYAVSENPHETLFNSEGLPASPFRHNMGRLPWSGHVKDDGLVRVQAEGKDKPRLNLAHVRADGYVFQLLPWRRAPGDAQATVSAYVGKAWNACVVETEGTELPAETNEEDGRQFVTFRAPVDGTWIIVAERGKAAPLRNIKRY